MSHLFKTTFLAVSFTSILASACPLCSGEPEERGFLQSAPSRKSEISNVDSIFLKTLEQDNNLLNCNSEERKIFLNAHFNGHPLKAEYLDLLTQTCQLFQKLSSESIKFSDGVDLLETFLQYSFSKLSETEQRQMILSETIETRELLKSEKRIKKVQNFYSQLKSKSDELVKSPYPMITMARYLNSRKSKTFVPKVPLPIELYPKH